MYFGNPPIITNGLILYLDAGNKNSYAGTGSLVWNDLSGNKNNGTLSGSTLPTYFINNSGILSFTGASSCFVETSTPVTTALTNVSLCVWFKTNNFAQAGQMLIHNGSDKNGNGYGFCLNNESVTTGEIRLLRAAIAWINTGLYITNQNWHYGVMTIRGESKIMSYYHDGRFVYDDGGGNINTPTLYTDIGRNDYIVSNPSVPRYFNGNISNVQIYNRALTASEVLQNYNATKGRYGL